MFKKKSTEKPPIEATPVEGMEHAGSPVSPEAINRLKSEKRAEIKYFYYQNNELKEIPPSVDRVDLTPRNPRELIIKIDKQGEIMEIRTFNDKEPLSPERRKYLIERIKNKLKKLKNE